VDGKLPYDVDFVATSATVLKWRCRRLLSSLRYIDSVRLFVSRFLFGSRLLGFGFSRFAPLDVSFLFLFCKKIDFDELIKIGELIVGGRKTVPQPALFNKKIIKII
jgi:hypothetical protein